LERSLIEDIVGGALVQEADPQQPHAPGQMASHYAPRATLRLNAMQPHAGEAYLGFGAHAAGPLSLSPKGDLVEAAAKLFRLLHEIDATGVAHIAVAPIPHTGLGEAINDRLARAAAPRSTP
jgi:L-threonylcarbamoyladenylate synthase